MATRARPRRDPPTPAGTRCRIPTCSRRRRPGGASVPIPPSWPTTTTGGMSAARLWWLLRWIGHDFVRVLDGGLAAWRAAGGDVERGPDEAAVPASSPLAARPGSLPTVTADDILAGEVGLLVDARAGERYRGEVEPSTRSPATSPAPSTCRLRQPRAPTARSSTPSRCASGSWRPASSPGEPVVAYCGSGITAAHELLALEVAGLGAATSLYAPSWSGWVADPTRPSSADAHRSGRRPRPASWPADAAHLGGTRGGEEALEVGGPSPAAASGPRAARTGRDRGQTHPGADRGRHVAGSAPRSVESFGLGQRACRRCHDLR